MGKENDKKTDLEAEAGMEQKIAMRVSIISIVVNLLLSLFKLAAGILAKSGAMISDAVHSASDVFSTFIVMIGVSISGKASDKDHPYGHERFECVASLFFGDYTGAYRPWNRRCRFEAGNTWAL